MEQPKLLLPWPVQDSDSQSQVVGSIIDHVLQVWTSSDVNQVVVVIRQDDQEMLERCRRWDVAIVQPDVAPHDMKESIMVGLEFLRNRNPHEQDVCLVAPADLPGLSNRIINRLISVPVDASTIVVPSFGGRQGHPVRIPWPLTHEIFALGPNQGIKHWIQRHPRFSVEFPAEDHVLDVDTPWDYQLALQKNGLRINPT